jgi:thiol-disulfide isomerase/thioredoxin
MRPRNVASRLHLACVLLLAALCAFAADETGQPAARFHAKTTTGDQLNNASVKGKVVLFEFWTTWCKYCETEASMVDDVAKEFADKGLIVLAVDVESRRSPEQPSPELLSHTIDSRLKIVNGARVLSCSAMRQSERQPGGI